MSQMPPFADPGESGPVEPTQPVSGPVPPVQNPAQPVPPAQDPGQLTQPVPGAGPGDGQPTQPVLQGSGLGTQILRAESPPARRRGRAALVTGIAVVAVAVLAGGGAFVWTALRSSGDQPERHLPASTAAMVKIDLDPSVEQKVGALRFAAKVPSSTQTTAAEDSDLRQTLYEQLARDTGPGWPSWSQVKPWLGERAALAVVPAGGEADPMSVVLLQVTDEQKAGTTLRGVRSDKPLGVAVGDGWAYVSDTTAHAETVLKQARAKPLDSDAGFAADRDQLDGEGIAAAWFDAARLQSAVGSKVGSLGLGGSDSGLPAPVASGTGAFVLRFTGADLELVGTFDGQGSAVTASKGTGVERLPTDTVAAVGLAGAGDFVAKQWSDLSKGLPSETLAEVRSVTGLRLPEDLEALLGQTFAVAMAGETGDEPQIGIRGTSSSPRLQAALEAVTGFAGTQGLPLEQRTVPGGYVLATASGQADAMVRGGDLGSSEQFRRAVPDADSAAVVVYVDLTRIRQLAGSSMDAESAASLEAFGALGFRAGSDGAGRTSVQVRLTTR